ncbi:hypothetical protein [Alkalihalobacillus sp. BA299]|uniref:hypothetical protein n=1 Tax=Alkalihalobacillus sp. BA299 TaxID=2815938 RepID=UPI001ADD415F|nr:hypothetical protein [Alkalihalobacillus sp. BA299]
MEMDVYDHESYRMSISNLIMLKIFHDEGINVQKFSNFMVHTQHNTSACSEIFWDGIKQVFANVKLYEYGDEIEGFKEKYPDLLTEDGQYPSPESIYTFQDPIFEQVICSPYMKQFESLFPPLTQLDMSELDIVILPDNSGIAYFCYFATFYHEIVKGILKLKYEAMKMNKRYEREKENGYSNQLFNRKSA